MRLRPKTKRANSEQLAKRFIARLEQGLLIDRTLPVNTNKPAKVKVPNGLRLSTHNPFDYQEEP
jgi:hypothetical protein